MEQFARFSDRVRALKVVRGRDERCGLDEHAIDIQCRTHRHFRIVEAPKAHPDERDKRRDRQGTVDEQPFTNRVTEHRAPRDRLSFSLGIESKKRYAAEDIVK